MELTSLWHASRTSAGRTANGAVSAAACVAFQTRLAERVTAHQYLGTLSESTITKSTLQELFRNLFRSVLAAVIRAWNVGG